MTNRQIYLADGNILVTHLRHANNFFTRLFGLMGTKDLQNSHGMLITPCQQIHTHFMRYSVDVLFLDKDMIVLEKVTALQPWRFTRFVRKARHVLEVPARAAHQVKIGDQLSLS